MLVFPMFHILISSLILQQMKDSQILVEGGSGSRAIVWQPEGSNPRLCLAKCQGVPEQDTTALHRSQYFEQVLKVK